MSKVQQAIEARIAKLVDDFGEEFATGGVGPDALARALVRSGAAALVVTVGPAKAAAALRDLARQLDGTLS